MGHAAGSPHYRHRPVLSCSRPALSRRIARKWLKATDGRRQYHHQGDGRRLPHDQYGNQGPTAARNEGSGCAMAAASGARQAVIVGVSGGWLSGAVVGLSDFAPGRAMPLLAWRSEVVMSADIGVFGSERDGYAIWSWAITARFRALAGAAGYAGNGEGMAGHAGLRPGGRAIADASHGPAP